MRLKNKDLNLRGNLLEKQFVKTVLSTVFEPWFSRGTKSKC